MSEQQPDLTGDYGYDLAHDAVRGQQTAAGRPHARPAGSAHASGTSDRLEDYAYDEAHDF
jgi:hypothetical protein